jgi:hypothetical protein
MTKLSKSEQKVIDSLRTGKRLPHDRKGRRTLRIENAIATLKTKGFIRKGADDVLFVTAKYDDGIAKANPAAFSDTELMLIRSAVWDYINRTPSLQPTYALGSEIIRKIKIVLP